MRSVLRAAALLFPACFHPNYDHPACGPGGACPSGLQCSAQGFCERPGAGPGNDAGSDAPGMASDASVMPDAARSTFCDPITGLVACYEFEGTAKDGSGNGLDATTANVTFAAGPVGQAMQVGANSSATVSANSLFDNVSAFTIEAWIQPLALPASGASAGILVVFNEYGLLINPDGTLECYIIAPTSVPTGTFYETTTTVPVGQWTHAVCTYDGATANVYINGSVVGTQIISTHMGGPPANGANGMGLAAGAPSGSQLVGLIDQLRLLNVARPAAEICADAGEICL